MYRIVEYAERDGTVPNMDHHLVYAYDSEKGRILVAACPSRELQRQVAWAFAAWHNIPLEEPT